jgi:alkylation response protein AidB-like acyl-CoA dehydrogenase
MDFKLSEQQEMLRKTIREFASNEIEPIAANIDKTGEFPAECIKKLAKLGVFGILLPPPLGGTGPDKLGFFIANEEISRASASISVALIYHSMVSSLILALGNDEQRGKFLPAMAKGERLGALGMVESSSGTSWPMTIQTSARADGDSYVINGSKSFVSNGGEADIYLVMAKTDPTKGPMGVSGIIVEKGTPGLSFGKKEEKLGLRGDVTCELVLEDCRVPRSNSLPEGITMPIMGVASTTSLPAIGAAAVGIASAAQDAAIEYVKQRTVMPGLTLANYDGIQYAIAEMAGKVEASRLLVYQASSVVGQPPDPIPGYTASIFACDAALEVTSRALEAFGTFGYTQDFPLERYYRDVRGLMFAGQVMESRKLTVGRLMLGLPPMGGPPGGGPPSGGPPSGMPPKPGS